MSRIALVNLVPGYDSANYLGFNQGLGSISAVLKADGHRVMQFVYSRAADDPSPLRSFQPDLVYVYLTTNQFGLFAHLSDTLFTRLGSSVYVGGPHPSAAPEDLLLLSGVAGVCLGEGENTARAIAAEHAAFRNFETVPNLWFKNGDQIVRNPVGDFVQDLDTLPFPDRTVFPYADMLRSPASRVMGFEFLATRGCVYGCRYCINPHWRKLHGKGCVRRRSVDHFLAEMHAVKDAFSYQGVIGIHDDIFTLDLAWLREFTHRYPREIGLPFWCNAHVSELNEEIISALKDAGCMRLHMGIECGNETMRAKVLNKHLANGDILDKIRLLKKHHIKSVTTFMIGLPDETEDNIKESIALCRAMAPDWVLLSVFCPYPGTALYTELLAKSRVQPAFYKNLTSDTFYAATPAYDQGVLSNETLKFYFDNFRKLAGVKG